VRQPLPVPESTASKAEWRAWARVHRAGIDPRYSGSRIAESLSAWPSYRSARRVLTYLAFGSEPELSPLLDDETKSFFTTRTSGEADASLTLHRLDLEALERHPFGFLQPAPGEATVSPNELDLVLVPGLAFDPNGNRLGFGMGYYDRLLPLIRPAVPLVGICPAALLLPELPAEPHDVRMTHVATEDGVFPVGSGAR
jgi:5-formyltetrahydrofolate cyclo-ligase